MEELDEVVSEEVLKRNEHIYFEEINKISPSLKAQFTYAWCLVKSKYPADIKKGIFLLENLFDKDVEGRRDYLYYLAIGHTRMKEYPKALEYCRAFLDIEPTNTQVQSLEEIIKKKINEEGKIGMAITVGGVLALGALVSLGVALVKSKN